MWRSRFIARSFLRDVPRRHQSFRQASSSGYRDPGWMVNDECDIEPDLVKTPLFTDTVRQDLFKKFKNDPEIWTVPLLSQHFGCTIERVKAIIFLLQRREDLMRENNVLDIPALWNVLIEKHDEAPLISTPEALAEEYELNVGEVKDILKRMTEHRQRLGVGNIEPCCNIHTFSKTNSYHRKE